VTVVSQVLVLFLLMAIGFIVAKIGVCGPEMAANSSKFVINITLPAMLIVSFIRPFSPELLSEAGSALLMSVASYAFAFLVAWLYPRFLRMKGPERGVHRYAIIISNCGFIGYPMVEAILGPGYVFHAVIYNIPFSLLAYSICAWLISKEGPDPLKLSWKTFVTPGVVATVAGFLLFVFSVSLPDPLYRSLKMLGDMTSPLSMIVIGINLAQARPSQVFGRWQIYVTTAMRLVVMPACIALGFYALGFRGPLLMLSVIIAAMPAGSVTSILASLYDVASEEASSLVFLSTALSMVTAPAVVILTEMLG
jgi:predicted permease